MAKPFHTVGHSTHPIDEFLDLLKGADITFVADVRTVPRSRTNPQYNIDGLATVLLETQIGYEHMAALGGLRGRQRQVPSHVNSFWQNASFHNYADYAMGDEFREGLARFREIGRAQRCAIMCAEALWWRCHRRIIADYLLSAGETVLHIMGPRSPVPARLTEAAKADPSGVLTYPAAA
jgi:uncharacterized protein (DUF488 family)